MDGGDTDTSARVEALLGRPGGDDPAALARAVREISEAELRRHLAAGEVRALVLEEVFARFPDYLDGARVAGITTAFGWRIDGEERVVALQAGRVAVHAGDEPAPRVVLELAAADFLLLVTGAADPAALFLTGDLRLHGDEPYALEIATWFRIPAGGDGAAVPVDVNGLDPVAMAAVVGSIADRDLHERLRGGMRDVILEQIFSRFPDFLDAERAAGTQATIAWRITGRPDGEADRWSVVIERGACRVLRDDDGIGASATIRCDAVEFLKIVTGNANPVMSFVRGRIKVKGDLPLAARLTSLFEIPSA